MSRIKPALEFTGSLEVEIQAPLDARTVVPTKADLTIASNFPYAYKGMPVYVEEEEKIYVLTNLDTTVLANWKEVGSGEGNTVSVELTQAEYDALTPAEKNNGTVYFITDGDGSGATLADVLENGNTANNTIVLEDASGSSTNKNTMSPVNMLINGNNGTVETRVNLQAGTSTAIGASREVGGVTSEALLYMSDNNGATKVEFRTSSDVKQAIRDGLNISDNNYTSTEKKVGTFLGKDLYEITLTNINIGFSASAEVTWSELGSRGIPNNCTIVDFESIAKQQGSSTLDYVNDGLIIRRMGAGWSVGNKFKMNIQIGALTLRYVKEAL